MTDGHLRLSRRGKPGGSISVIDWHLKLPRRGRPACSRGELFSMIDWHLAYTTKEREARLQQMSALQRDLKLLRRGRAGCI